MSLRLIKLSRIKSLKWIPLELKESVEVKNTEIGRLQNSGLADHIIDFNEKIDSHNQKDIELKGEIDKLRDKTENLDNDHIEMNSATNSLKQAFEESSSEFGELIRTQQDHITYEKVNSYTTSIGPHLSG